jgi:DNA adenine methylase
MKYMGSKARIAKEILPIILKGRKEGQFYVEPFVGGANIIDKVDGNRIGADNNKYLIAMWKELQNGWIPPKFIDREMYNNCRMQYNENSANTDNYHIIGYVGFNGSYGGRFYDGGYAGITTTKQNKERNYPIEAYNNVIAQIGAIKNVLFKYGDYKDVVIPEKSILYCDIPYFGTKEYKSAKNFNHSEFCDWARQKAKDGHTVYVSEYNMPDDFICVWEKEVSSSLRANGVISGDKKSIEKLFKLEV